MSLACSHCCRKCSRGWFAASARSRCSGRPSIKRETRDLIRQVGRANPLWGAPRIHGELLKPGIEISQATVAKYMIRRPGSPSPTWRGFLHNQALGPARSRSNAPRYFRVPRLKESAT